MIELVAFLGNHGKEYAGNRHNAGWLLAEQLPEYGQLSWQRKFKGLYAGLDSGRLDPLGAGAAGPPDRPARIHLVKPETYMNLSGDAVAAAADFFKIPPARILVVHDELELPLGTVSFKFSGGLGGHNGLRSLKARLGTADFWRLRVGIGRPGHDDISGWVLSDFTPAEAALLDPVLSAAAEALRQALLAGPESLLPEWNKKRLI